MAVHDSRSKHHAMRRGATDGKYTSLTPDRGGEVDPTAATARMTVTKAMFPTGEVYSFTERHPLSNSGL